MSLEQITDALGNKIATDTIKQCRREIVRLQLLQTYNRKFGGIYYLNTATHKLAYRRDGHENRKDDSKSYKKD